MRVKKYSGYPALKKKMKQKNVSYRRLSKELKLSVDAVNSSLNGYSDFRVKDFITTMQLLQVPPTEYFLYMEL